MLDTIKWIQKHNTARPANIEYTDAKNVNRAGKKEQSYQVSVEIVSHCWNNKYAHNKTTKHTMAFLLLSLATLDSAVRLN